RLGSWAVLIRSCRSQSSTSVLRSRSTVNEAIVPLRSKASCRLDVRDPVPAAGDKERAGETVTSPFCGARGGRQKIRVSGPPRAPRPLIAGAVRVDADAELALRRAGRPRRAVGRPQIARLALVRVDLGVATAVGELAGRAAPLAAGRRVGDAVVRPVVALLAAVGLQRPVAAERTVLTLRRAAVVDAVGVHAVAAGGEGVGVGAAIALLAARLNAVAALRTALGLGGLEAAERQLVVRLRRVAVGAEDGDLVGAPYRQVEVGGPGAAVAV